MRLALYQPDIPQNTGTILRLAACLGLAVDVIGPTGFDMRDKALRRSGLDYIDEIELIRHLSWEDFLAAREPVPHACAPRANQLVDRREPVCAQGPARIILLTTKATTSYLDFSFRTSDILLLGRESAGAPAPVHNIVDARVTIPLQAGFRSLNIAVAAAMVLGEALRQTGGFAAPIG